MAVDITCADWNGVRVAELLCYCRQVLDNYTGGKVADCVRTYIFLEESHQRDHLRVTDSQFNDLFTRPHDRFANVLGSRATRSSATPVSKTILGGFPKIEETAGCLPGGIILPC